MAFAPYRGITASPALLGAGLKVMRGNRSLELSWVSWPHCVSVALIAGLMKVTADVNTRVRKPARQEITMVCCCKEGFVVFVMSVFDCVFLI